MPWRENILTPFRVGSNSDSEFSEVFSISDLQSGVSESVLKPSLEQPEVSVRKQHSGFSLEEFDGTESQGAGDQDAASAQASNPWSLIAGGADVVSDPHLDELPAKPLDAQQFGRLVSTAFLNNARVHDISMPWESDVAKQIFSDDLNLDVALTVPPLMHRTDVVAGLTTNSEVVLSLGEVAAGEVDRGAPVFFRAVKNVSDISEVDRRNKALEAACMKWMTILEFDLGASSVGKSISERFDPEGTLDDVFKTIEAVIGVKSPYTATSRANSLLAYSKWVFKHFSNVDNLFSESFVWQYFNMLRDSDAAPTVASSAMSAFRYAQHVFGFEGLGRVTLSRRLVGLSEILFAQKAALRQARVLSVSDVRMLHKVLDDSGRDAFDRAAAGFVLLGIYGRCRHSDMSNIDHIVQDFDDTDGYIELFTRVHKSARGAVRKSLFLPILIPVVGIQGTNWVSTLDTVFSECGLSLKGFINGPIFRPPSRLNPEMLCKRSVSSGECGAMIRGLLGGNMDTPGRGVEAYTSHTMKATSLSWAAKFGMTEFDRAVLGRHSSSTSSTTAVYSRDLSVRSVSKFKEVIRAIQVSEFMPDAPRSQYFKFPPTPADLVDGGEKVNASEVQLDQEVVKVESDSDEGGDASKKVGSVVDLVEVKLEPVVDGQFVVEGCLEISESEASSVSCGDSEESDFEDEIVARPSKSRKKNDTIDAASGQWYFHRKSKLLHMCYEDGELSLGDVKYFVCGKILSKNYSKMCEAEAGNVICILCNRKVR